MHAHTHRHTEKNPFEPFEQKQQSKEGSWSRLSGRVCWLASGQTLTPLVAWIKRSEAKQNLSPLSDG